MEMFIGLMIGTVGGAFIGVVIMALCIASSRSSRDEENKANELK